MKSIDGLPLDYFAGGVPSRMIFEGSSYELRKLVSNTNKQEGFLDIISEVSFIGIVSYFEAFFKNHFASIINICPELIHQLKKSGHDVFVDPTDILNAKSEFYRKLGFYISEKYDFGTAQKVNALFVSILNISPFSKKEKIKYDSILCDRNLLVHHGGIYTSSYSKQKFY